MASRLRSRRTPVGFIEALTGDGTAIARALSGAKSAPSPDFIAPALATLRSTVPTATNFVHELKLDGYRIQVHVLEGRATLYTRSGLDWTNRFATIAADARRLPANALVLDGEIISAGPDGRPDFSALQDDLEQCRQDRFVYSRKTRSARRRARRATAQMTRHRHCRPRARRAPSVL